MLSAATPTAFAQMVRAQIPYLVSAPKDVELVVDHELHGDQTTIGGAAAEMMTDDLGPQLSAIAAPLLVIAPAPNTSVAAQMREGYTGLYAGVRDLTVVSIAPSKHFVMLDQPAQFMETLNAFLTKN